REPVVSGHVGIEAAVAISDDVEPLALLVAHVHRNSVQVLLAIAPIDHRLAEVARAEILGVPARPRQRANDARRQDDVRGRGVHQLRPSLTCTSSDLMSSPEFFACMRSSVEKSSSVMPCPIICCNRSRVMEVSGMGTSKLRPASSPRSRSFLRSFGVNVTWKSRLTSAGVL